MIIHVAISLLLDHWLLEVLRLIVVIITAAVIITGAVGWHFPCSLALPAHILYGRLGLGFGLARLALLIRRRARREAAYGVGLPTCMQPVVTTLYMMKRTKNPLNPTLLPPLPPPPDTQAGSRASSPRLRCAGTVSSSESSSPSSPRPPPGLGRPPPGL